MKAELLVKNDMGNTLINRISILLFEAISDALSQVFNAFLGDFGLNASQLFLFIYESASSS